MTRKQKRQQEAPESNAGTPEPQEQPMDSAPGDPESSGASGLGSGSEGPGADGALAEPLDQAVLRLEDELGVLKDRHLRLAAEYENFRKRTARERSELWSRAQADVVAGLLDALDDLGRVSDLDPEVASPGDVIKGVELVERKMLKELEAAGLERVGDVGEPFDPNHHEAVGSLPAPSAEEDHTVGAVLQPGYKFSGALIRPARVQVRMWNGEAPEG